MTAIYSYLTFNGNCREAMSFYKACLGGKLTFQTVKQSPMSARMPARMRDCIVQSVLKKDEFVLIGTDLVGDSGLLKGNAVSLMLRCESERQAKSCYRKLAEGGHVTNELKPTEDGGIIGNLVDKFGTYWIIYA